MASRLFHSRIPYHIYIRSFDRGLIFYSTREYLVYFTFITTMARRYRIELMELSIMPDHVHMLAKSLVARNLDLFLAATERLFAREYNEAIGRSGSLFEIPGHAPKKTDKKIRSCIAYLFNNQVEKKMVTMAESARWNFMAYAVSDHPFSAPIKLDKASRALRRAIKLVKYFRTAEKPLVFKTLEKLFSSLGLVEKEQLTDFIISSYNCLDYDSIIAFFGSYEKMRLAVNSNTGSEFDIVETYDTASDAPYSKMSATVSKIEGLKDIKKVMMLDPDMKIRLANNLLQIPGVTARHIQKFLHIRPGSQHLD